MIGEGIGHVVVLGEFCDELVVLSEDTVAAAFEFRVLDGGVEEIAGAIPEAVRLVKATIEWPVRFAAAIVPFAADASLVASEFHRFAESDHLVVDQFNAASALSRVEAREQCRSGGGAFGVVVELSEAQAVGCHFVEIGSLDDFGAVGPNVGPAHVVDHDQDDIGFLAGVGDRGECS